MTEVIFVASIQGHQVERTRDFAERLRKAPPDLAISVVEGDAAEALLGRYKLKFGPAIVVDGRLEYVGIPRWRYLQERLPRGAHGPASTPWAGPPDRRGR